MKPADTGLPSDNQAKTLDKYISQVREAYQGKAELRYMPDWVNYYWVLCPKQ